MNIKNVDIKNVDVWKQFCHSDLRYLASNPVPKERLMSIVPHPEEQNLLNKKMPSVKQQPHCYHFLNNYFSAKKELIKADNICT